MKQFNLVSIILPTYNEAENIIDLIKEINRKVKHKKELIVVDDNSPDGTSEIVRNYSKMHRSHQIRIKTRRKNPGLTNSLKDGISIAEGDIVGWMDCDFSMPPSTLPKLIRKIEEGFDIAVGSRFIKGGKNKEVRGSRDSLLAVKLSNLINYIARVSLGSWFKDYTSGFVMAKKEALREIKLEGDYGEYMIGFIVRSKRLGYKITEVPYTAIARTKGESKTGHSLWQYIKKGCKYISKIYTLIIIKQ